MNSLATMISLTDEQQRIADSVIKNRYGDVTIGGMAGTGKTVLGSYLSTHIPGSIVVAPTGKAAQVLRNKGVKAETIHSVFYIFVRAKDKLSTKGEVTGKFDPVFMERDDLKQMPTRIIVDEASMVNTSLYYEIRSHNVPVIWIGDYGQLPPVGADPGIMANLDHRLQTIHRQAEGSPIIALAYRLRNGDKVANQTGDEINIYDKCSSDRLVSHAIKYGVDQILCAFNNTRHAINREYRSQLGYTGKIHIGDKVVCLRNNRNLGIFNGMVFTIVEIDSLGETVAEVKIRDEFTRKIGTVKMFLPQFGGGAFGLDDIPNGAQLFDFAYALTVHKSQGSEWPHVLMVDQYCPKWDMTRWRYTAATRAKEKLTIVKGCYS